MTKILLLWRSQAEESKPWLWSNPVCSVQWGKRRQKKYLLSLIPWDFLQSAMSVNYLFESKSFLRHSTKFLLKPSQKSASSVCLWAPSSVNHTTTCQPLPKVPASALQEVRILLLHEPRNILGVIGERSMCPDICPYTYSGNSITSSFSNISSMFFRAPALPRMGCPGLLWNFLTSAGFHKVSAVNGVSISTAEQHQLLSKHIWSHACGSGNGVCFQRSCFHHFKVFHPCIIIDASPLHGRCFSHFVLQS